MVWEQKGRIILFTLPTSFAILAFSFHSNRKGEGHVSHPAGLGVRLHHRDGTLEKSLNSLWLLSTRFEASALASLASGSSR